MGCLQANLSQCYPNEDGAFRVQDPPPRNSPTHQREPRYGPNPPLKDPAQQKHTPDQGYQQPASYSQG